MESSPSATSDNKIWFNGGHYVRHKLPNSPLMLVVGTQKLVNLTEGTRTFNGVICTWFTASGEMIEKVINSKDLYHVSKTEVDRLQYEQTI